MIEFINNLAIAIFGSLENWNNYTIDNSTMYSEFFTSLIKLTPQIIAFTCIAFLIIILMFIIYKLVRVFI